MRTYINLPCRHGDDIYHTSIYIGGPDGNSIYVSFFFLARDLLPPPRSFVLIPGPPLETRPRNEVIEEDTRFSLGTDLPRASSEHFASRNFRGESSMEERDRERDVKTMARLIGERDSPPLESLCRWNGTFYCR